MTESENKCRGRTIAMSLTAIFFGGVFDWPNGFDRVY